MLQNWPGNAALGARAFGRSFPPWGVACLAVAVAISYFLAARLSLALLTKPDGVAVFWPAAGLSAGAIICLGPRVRLPVIVGVMAATIGANLLGDRNIPSSIIFALVNAFEAVLVAGLIERYFGSPFRLDTLQRVLGLTAAAILGCVVSGIGGTAGFLLFHDASVSALEIWFHWFASDAVGIVTVAPFVIGLVAMARDPPSLKETVEGSVALTLLAITCSVFAFIPQAPDDLCLVSTFPLLLWIAARCRPVFLAAAVFIIAIAIVWMTTFEIGMYGNPMFSIEQRILNAQVVVTSLTFCALVLGALFGERRDVEMLLQEALKTGRAAAFAWDFRNGLLQLSENAAQLLGLNRRQTAASFLERIHADDRLRVEACVCDLRPNNPLYAISYRYLRPDGQQIWIEFNRKSRV